MPKVRTLWTSRPWRSSSFPWPEADAGRQSDQRSDVASGLGSQDNIGGRGLVVDCLLLVVPQRPQDIEQVGEAADYRKDEDAPRSEQNGFHRRWPCPVAQTHADTDDLLAWSRTTATQEEHLVGAGDQKRDDGRGDGEPEDVPRRERHNRRRPGRGLSGNPITPVHHSADVAVVEPAGEGQRQQAGEDHVQHTRSHAQPPARERDTVRGGRRVRLPAPVLLSERAWALPVCRPLVARGNLALQGRVIASLGRGGALCSL